MKADFILLSHGHGDHVGDTVAIAKRTGATVLTNFEVGQWLEQARAWRRSKVIGMNPGGGIEQPFGHVKFTIAHHSSSMPDGSYGGVPGGFLLKLDECARVFRVRHGAVSGYETDRQRRARPGRAADRRPVHDGAGGFDRRGQDC